MWLLSWCCKNRGPCSVGMPRNWCGLEWCYSLGFLFHLWVRQLQTPGSMDYISPKKFWDVWHASLGDLESTQQGEASTT